MTTQIQLTNNTWAVDFSSRVGPPGGFGEVFAGTGPNGTVAIKRLNINATDSASRELKMAERLKADTLQNVVQVFDYGLDQDSDRYFIVMPLLQYSLEEYCQNTGILSISEALKIALDIVAGLEEVGDIVHRDLKPGNILFDGNNWKIADFGIARFVADSTASKTLKACLSPNYAAPEQWRYEKSTYKTDIYALAGIIYRMIAGTPPFVGNLDELKKGHETVAFPDLPVKGRLLSVMKQMGRKSQDVRPSLQTVKSQLQRVLLDNKNGDANVSRLAELNAEIDVERSEAEAAANTRTIKIETQKEIADAGIEALNDIRDDLFAAIIDQASNAARPKPEGLKLGRGNIHFELPAAYIREPNNDDYDNPRSGYFINAWSRYSVHCSIAREFIQYKGVMEYIWSATLFYAKANDADEYRWYEVGFWNLSANSAPYPYAINVPEEIFETTLSKTMTNHQLCFGPRPIDYDDSDGFSNRVTGLFTKAAKGRLMQPNQSNIPHSYYEID